MIYKAVVGLFLLTVACGQPNDHANTTESVVRSEISQTREQFWAAARSGNADSMLAFHLDSSEVYRLYENGESFDYNSQVQGHKNIKDAGVTRIDFNVQVKDPMVFSRDYAMETWDGNTVTWSKSGNKDTFGRFIVTILYQHTPEGWKFRYLHSSNKPK